MAKTKTKKRAAAKGGTKAGRVIKETWAATLEALTSTQQEIEKQVKLLLKKNKLTGKEAQSVLKSLSTRLEKERKRALKQLESRLKTLQARVKKERNVVGRLVDDGVRRTLATFNIPSRQEVAELTRKVEELSRKIDGFKRRPAAPRREAIVTPAIHA